MRKKLSLVSLILILALFAGCVSVDKKTSTAIGLKITKDVFISVGKTAKRLSVNGILSRNDYEIVESAYRNGRNALIDAKAVWDDMVVMNSFDNSERYGELILRVVKLTETIETIVRKYTDREDN
jgi:hypothetical protein